MDNDDKLTTFMLQEYNNIAQAHFNLTNTITSFFKHYLLIISIPITLITLIINYSAEDVYNIYRVQQFIIGFTILLYCVGFAIMLYIVNLRFDSILYARTVNGIRKFFYDNSNLSSSEESKYRVLPTRTDKPSLANNIIPMIIAFYLLNTGYPVAALWWFDQSICLIICVLLLSLLLHITVIYVILLKKEKTFSDVFTH